MSSNSTSFHKSIGTFASSTFVAASSKISRCSPALQLAGRQRLFAGSAGSAGSADSAGDSAGTVGEAGEAEC